MQGRYKNILIIITKNLVKGAVKTRLAKDIGDNAAYTINKTLIKHTQNITRPLKCDKIVWYSDYINRNDEWNNEMYQKATQSGNNLGDRMKNAFYDAFDRGYEKAVIIGTDCYQLTTGIIQEAFNTLNRTDLVFGPANDGGYYLAGMKSFFPDMFDDIQWGTNTVLQNSIRKSKHANLSYEILETLVDIDLVTDLEKLPSLKRAIEKE